MSRHSKKKNESSHFNECSEVKVISLRRRKSDDPPDIPSDSGSSICGRSVAYQEKRPKSTFYIPKSIASNFDKKLTKNSKAFQNELPTEKNIPAKSSKSHANAGRPQSTFFESSSEPKRGLQSSSVPTTKIIDSARSSERPVPQGRNSDHPVSPSYKSKMKGDLVSLVDFLPKEEAELLASLSKDSSPSRAPIYRSVSEHESNSERKQIRQAILRNAYKSRSLKVKEEPLLKQVVMKVMPFKRKCRSDSNIDEGGSSLFQRRQTDVGGSAPTSPQTGAKLPKIPNLWRKNLQSNKDKGKNENSNDSPVEKDRTSPSGVCQSPAHVYNSNNIAGVNASNGVKTYDDTAVRRCNTLKIWIQEVKDIPDKKSYYCQIILDGRIYYRTTLKYKNGLCFWGEQFECNHISEHSVVTVRLLRREKDKEKLIGSVEFEPGPSIQEPRLDQWMSLVTEKSSKETPSIRCRYFLQKVTVLPLLDYAGFTNYLKESAFSVCTKLEGHLNVRAKEDVVKYLISVLQHHKKAVSFLGQLIIYDVEEKGKPDETMFRGNSMATKAIEAYMKLMSSHYLKATLQRSINAIILTGKTLEVDPNKINSGEPGSIQEFQSNLENAIGDVWNAILRSHRDFPVELQHVFYAVRERIKRPELTDNLISACVFLRLLCPAILSPSLFSLTKEYPEVEANRKLTLVTKTIQTLANFTTYQSKEICMQFLNPFILREQENCRQFLRTISGPLGQRKTANECDEVTDSGLQTALLHMHLKHALDSINIECLDPELRRLKRQVDYLCDCLSRHDKTSFQLNQRFNKVSESGPIPAYRRDVPPQTQHRQSPLATRRPMSAFQNCDRSYERSVSCRPDLSSPKPTSTDNRSDTSNAFNSQRNMSQGDNNLENNNVIGSARLCLTEDQNNFKNSPEFDPQFRKNSVLSPTPFSRHKNVIKSISTIHRDDCDVVSNNGWSPVINSRDTENNVNDSYSSLCQVSPRASSGYHSVSYSPSTSPIDRVTYGSPNVNGSIGVSSPCKLPFTGAVPFSPKGTPMHMKSFNKYWSVQDTEGGYAVPINRLGLQQSMQRDIHSERNNSPQYRGSKSESYSSDSTNNYDRGRTLPVCRSPSSSSSSSPCSSTPRRGFHRRQSIRNGTTVNGRHSNKSSSSIPRTNPHFSPRLSAPSGWPAQPRKKQNGLLANAVHYDLPLGDMENNYAIDSWNPLHSKEDHMQAILERLLSLEQQMREEQVTLLQEMSVKDRLLAKQERHIAALDTANSRLIRQIASLTASSPSPTTGEKILDGTDQAEDLSLESLSTSDNSDTKSSSPC